MHGKQAQRANINYINPPGGRTSGGANILKDVSFRKTPSTQLLNFQTFMSHFGNKEAYSLFKKIEFRGQYKRDLFYKFLEPCNHPKYRAGDSWTEEVGMCRKTFQTHFAAFGTRYHSKTEYLKHLSDPFQGKLYLSYYDRKDGRTWFLRNESLIAELFPNWDKISPAKSLNTKEGRGGQKVSSLSDFRSRAANSYRDKDIYINNKHTAYKHDASQNLDFKKEFPLGCEMYALWQEIVGTPALKNEQVLSKLEAFLEEKIDSAMDSWKELCGRVGASRFLMGEKEDKTFRASLSWVINSGSYKKILAGVYGNDRDNSSRWTKHRKHENKRLQLVEEEAKKQLEDQFDSVCERQRALQAAILSKFSSHEAKLLLSLRLKGQRIEENGRLHIALSGGDDVTQDQKEKLHSIIRSLFRDNDLWVSFLKKDQKLSEHDQVFEPVTKFEILKAEKDAALTWKNQETKALQQFFTENMKPITIYDLGLQKIIAQKQKRTLTLRVSDDRQEVLLRTLENPNCYILLADGTHIKQQGLLEIFAVKELVIENLQKQTEEQSQINEMKEMYDFINGFEEFRNDPVVKDFHTGLLMAVGQGAYIQNQLNTIKLWFSNGNAWEGQSVVIYPETTHQKEFFTQERITQINENLSSEDPSIRGTFMDFRISRCGAKIEMKNLAYL